MTKPVAERFRDRFERSFRVASEQGPPPPFQAWEQPACVVALANK